MNGKIKVGYLPFYIKLYDDSNPHYRDPMVRYMQGLITMLRTQGLDVIEADEVCRTRDEFDRAARKFNEADVDAVITQHLAYSPSLESIDALLSLRSPIIVFDTTMDYEVAKVQQYENRISANHGIHGVQDMCNLLKRNGHPYYLCVGHALHSEVLSEVVGMCRAATAAKTFREEKVGAVGGEFHGMGDFKISDEQYKKEIGPTVSYLTPDIAAGYLKQVSDKEVDEDIAGDREHYNVQVKNEDNYRLAARSGLAIRKWMAAQGINAVTVNFSHINESGIPKMPFVECCKILGRGQGYAGEGDTLTAGLVGALLSVYPNTTFTEMFIPDWERDMILLSHMGESNPNLAQWEPLVKDMPFNYNSSGDTVAMYNCYRPGSVVLVNLAPMQHGFALILAQADIVDMGLERGAYRESTQGWFKPHMPVAEFLKKYSMAGGTHHSAMVYDGNIEELTAFGQMMGFEVVVIR